MAEQFMRLNTAVEMELYPPVSDVVAEPVGIPGVKGTVPDVSALAVDVVVEDATVDKSVLVVAELLDAQAIYADFLVWVKPYLDVLRKVST